MSLYINGERQDAVALNLAHTWLANQTFNDNVKLLLGTGIDAALYYDGSHLYIDPKEVGSGRVKILGDLDLTPDAESGTPSTTGAWLNQTAQTFTDNATAASGTVAAHAFNSFQQPIFDSLNGGVGTEVTLTDGAGLILQAPAPVTDKSLITNPWALWLKSRSTASARVLLVEGGNTGANYASQMISFRRYGETTERGGLGLTNVNALEFRGFAGIYMVTSGTIATDTALDLYLNPASSIVTVKGGSALKSSSATEIGLQVTNGSLTVGSEGSIELPYLSQAAAAFTDAIGGNLDGCIGINHDSSPGADTIEVRVEGSWLSVAVAGYLIQNTVPYTASQDIWVHPNQVKDGKWLDETVCIVCGEQMNPKDAISMYGNYWAGKRGLHAIFGHQHLERDNYIQKLAARVKELEARVPVAA